MKKLAIVFPGWRHSADRALLYYPEKVLRLQGFETILMHYDEPRDGEDTGFSPEEAIEKAWDFVKARLQEVDLGAYEEFFFVSKSMGTVLAGRTEKEWKLQNVRQLFLTPIEETFPYFRGKGQLAVAGTEDVMVEIDRLKENCRDKGLPLLLFEGVGHNLESPSMKETLRILGEILGALEKVLDKKA